MARGAANAVGVNGAVISEVIPELELLLGPQPEVPTLPPDQAQGRFTTTFMEFVRACSSPRQPLILFLDDLQWADESSLDFLQAFLADPQPAHLLIIGAYRDSEVGPDHRLKRLIAALTNLGRPPDQIHLTALDLASIRQLLTDTLLFHHRNGQSMELLTDLLYQKSSGNPFFITTLLQTLHENGLLTLTDSHQGWKWDMAALQQVRLSDNVIDLLLQKLDRLPLATLDLLKQSACLGNTFSLTTLHWISRLDYETLYTQLGPALQADLIREQGETISFEHDRVQEAVYLLLSESERQQHHWQIGRLLLGYFDEHTLDDQLFTVVNHLNQGRSLAHDPAIRARLVELNYQAGLKARNSIAFDASLAYFEMSRGLLPADSWSKDYAQTYRVWSELLMAQTLLLRHEAVFATADVILANAQSDLDRARCYRRLVSLHAWQSNFAQALAVGNRALALFGQPLPADKQEARQAIGEAMKYVLTHLTGHEAILNLAEMTDPTALVQLEIRHELTPALYRTSAELLVLNNFAHDPAGPGARQPSGLEHCLCRQRRSDDCAGPAQAGRLFQPVGRRPVAALSDRL
ncbi:MAG: AAA family ATPase [Anaerolineales bacterium]|nr:AAA family ATPase [Anaerolineales bacterium]